VKSNPVGLLAGMLACAALATGMSPALAAETLTMVTTGKGSAQQWPIFIAIAKGYMGENGVTLDLVGTSSTAAAMQQLAARSANIASGGLTDPLRAIDKGAPISLLRVEAQVPPYTLWAKPTIKSVADLRGKLIIIGGTKDITRIYLERTLIPNGVKPGEFDMIFAGTTTARFAGSTTTSSRFERSLAKRSPRPSSADVVPSPWPPPNFDSFEKPEMAVTSLVAGSRRSRLPVRPPGTIRRCNLEENTRSSNPIPPSPPGTGTGVVAAAAAAIRARMYMARSLLPA